MQHLDFRVAGKIFATLAYPEKTCGMVKLAPEDQHNFSKDYPEAFVPMKGTWGRRGATSVLLKSARKEIVRMALEAAGAILPRSSCWRNPRKDERVDFRREAKLTPRAAHP